MSALAQYSYTECMNSCFRQFPKIGDNYYKIVLKFCQGGDLVDEFENPWFKTTNFYKALFISRFACRKINHTIKL